MIIKIIVECLPLFYPDVHFWPCIWPIWLLREVFHIPIHIYRVASQNEFAAKWRRDHTLFLMDDLFENLDGSFNFDAIGNWRSIAKEDGTFERVFVPGDDILRYLRVILRYLAKLLWLVMDREIKQEFENYREFSIQLTKLDVVNKKLLPLFLMFVCVTRCNG